MWEKVEKFQGDKYFHKALYFSKTMWKKILNKCSLDIILLTIEYLQEAIKITKEEITSIETQLTSTLSNSEFSTLKSMVDSILTTHQRTLEERKRTKFQSDTEDYLTNKVYKWEDPFPCRKDQDTDAHQGELPLRVLLANRGLLCRIRQRDWWSPNIRTVFFRTKRTPIRRARKKKRGSPHDTEITDTGDFLDKIHNISNIPPDSLLCTLDVNSLYTSITHDKGIEAVSLTLQEANIEKDSQGLCLDLLNLVLRKNFFLFEDDFFVQTCRSAMGSSVAPAYANLYMDRFEPIL
ncbi:unnamed protein product [Ranitomeya imitator]|uniref:Reverse transcriptase domain-containing protein n=1 Tax=Ranitomeya imitator TaxID=111125 RepID=A0ABN9LQR0_9NEOB|nr:unnamed protein product [Ranitomeya imitator]